MQKLASIFELIFISLSIVNPVLNVVVPAYEVAFSLLFLLFFGLGTFWVIESSVPIHVGGGIKLFFVCFIFPVFDIVLSNNFVYIEHPLNIISFLVNVPVLSLKINLILPNCSIKSVL